LPGQRSLIGTPCQQGQGATVSAPGAGGANGGVAGASLLGGGGNDAAGGTNGGGGGEGSTGGGGGGFFGGGSGGTCSAVAGGGGGGSAYTLPAATNVTAKAGAGATPASTDHPDYVVPVAAGGTPGSYPPSERPTAGNPGLVVVRLAKP